MKIKDLFKPKIIKETVYKEMEPLKGWFVWEAGQNPLCCYWFCTLCSFTLKGKDGYNISVSVEDCQTFSEAITQANKKAEEIGKGFSNTLKEINKNGNDR